MIDLKNLLVERSEGRFFRRNILHPAYRDRNIFVCMQTIEERMEMEQMYWKKIEEEEQQNERLQRETDENIF